MGNIWDINQSHPINRKKSRRTRKQRAPEEHMTSGVNQLMKTTSDFTLGAMGIAVMSNMGFSVISALSKK